MDVIKLRIVQLYDAWKGVSQNSSQTIMSIRYQPGVWLLFFQTTWKLYWLGGGLFPFQNPICTKVRLKVNLDKPKDISD